MLNITRTVFKSLLRFNRGNNADSVNRTSPDGIVFDRQFYKDITDARIKHLQSLDLPIANKTLVDLGCGIGRISEFFVGAGSDVLCVDGRRENIEKLQEIYPDYRTAIVDLETNDILRYGKFDVVSCYGLLYHLADPFGLIKNIYKICNDFVIVETCITDSVNPMLHLVNEHDDPTQALCGVGCRPSPSYIVQCLKLSGFKHVYVPVEMPEHEEFRYKLVNDFTYLKRGKLIRGIYIAAHNALENLKLVEIS